MVSLLLESLAGKVHTFSYERRGSIIVSYENRHGLNRNIPADVKRVVRQHDGFGCVVCGSAIYTYEHIDPTFVDATAHEPNNIALLCASCHDRVTRGQLSKTTVKGAKAHPKCLEKGFSYGPFDVGTMHPEIKIGPVTATNVPIVIEAMGDAILKVEPPEIEGGPFRLSARLANKLGAEVLYIEQNEWMTPTSNWDVQLIGPRIKIHSAPRDVALILRVDPPKSIILERLAMYYRGVRLIVREPEGLTIVAPDGNMLVTSGATLWDCRIALQVSGNGIAVGVGGGSMYIDRMSINPTSA